MEPNLDDDVNEMTQPNESESSDDVQAPNVRAIEAVETLLARWEELDKADQAKELESAFQVISLANLSEQHVCRNLLTKGTIKIMRASDFDASLTKANNDDNVIHLQVEQEKPWPPKYPEEKLQQQYKIGESVLQCKSILDKVVSAIRENGVAGQENPIKLLYLALATQFVQGLKRLSSVMFVGPFGSGKTFTLEAVLALIPEEAKIETTGMSPKALVRDKRPYQHRHLIIGEAAGLAHSGEGQNHLRQLIWEGRLNYLVAGPTDVNDGESLVLKKEGPTGVIMTTVDTSLDPETQSRILNCEIDASQEQARRARDARANHWMKVNESNSVDLAPWHAAFRYLACRMPNVTIPYAGLIAEMVREAVGHRMNRDFEQLMALIAAHAALHLEHRDRGIDGETIASLDDYEVAYDLIIEIVHKENTEDESRILRETVDAVNQFIERENHGPSVTQLAKFLNVDKSTASRRVGEAESHGVLEMRIRGREGCIMPKDPLPTSSADVLPTPCELREVWESRNEKIAQQCNEE
jgi:hypothetical protein